MAIVFSVLGVEISILPSIFHLLFHIILTNYYDHFTDEHATFTFQNLCLLFTTKEVMGGVGGGHSDLFNSKVLAL